MDVDVLPCSSVHQLDFKLQERHCSFSTQRQRSSQVAEHYERPLLPAGDSSPSPAASDASAATKSV